MDKSTARSELIGIVRQLLSENRNLLDDQKKRVSDLDRPDFIWHYFLVSMATWGGSLGARELIRNGDNYRLVDYDNLSKLNSQQRQDQITKACHQAGLRYPNVKAKCIAECFDQVAEMGGPEAAKTLLLAREGKEGKMQFLRQLPGIGPKYAWNIMMDVYHPEFRECIAIDTRIKAITKALGLHFDGYKEHEDFYLSVASGAGIEGWELDRLLYGLRERIEKKISVI